MRLLFPLLAACSAEGTLAPSLELADDPMLQTFPADSTLVGGAEEPAAALFDSRLAGLRLGCGPGGCVALAEGSFTPLVDADFALDGDPLAFRLLTATKAVGGDLEAMARLEALQRRLGDGEPVPTFDPAALDGLVPIGDAWIATTDVRGMLEHASARLASHPELAESLTRRTEDYADELSVLRSAALSVSIDGEDATVRVRGTCDEGTQAAIAEHRLRRLARAYPATVVREGRTVELTWYTDTDTLLRGTAP